MAHVTIWHPETEHTTSVPEQAVNAYRQSGWLRLDERDGWLAAVESAAGVDARLAEAAATTAKTSRAKGAGDAGPTGGAGTKAGQSGEGS